MAALSVSFQWEITHRGFKGAEEKECCVKQISLSHIFNFADFKAKNVMPMKKFPLWRA